MENIVKMGYPEVEVRKALAASFNNPERAVEYLIEGIPEGAGVAVAPATPERLEYDSDTELDTSFSPVELFRNDPLFRSLKMEVVQNPQLI